MKEETELARIMKSGVLRAVVDYNSTNYFIYRGVPMGFKYEILQHLASDMRLSLELSVNNDVQQTFDDLLALKYDLIARNLIVTKGKHTLVDYTEPLEQTRQVLVQRKPYNWRLMMPDVVEDSLIRNQIDLGGKQVYVPKGSAYYRRMLNLSEEIGEDIELMEDSLYGCEQLVSMVARGEIDYTVCDEHTARVNTIYYPDLDVETPVSFPQKVAWAVRHDAPEWLNYLNSWIINFRNSPDYRTLYRKYFESPRSGLRFNSDYYSYTGGKLSPWDELIREEATTAGLDWRLVAAVISQESGFDPEAESWIGAYGLMQVMPESADMFQIFDYKSPRGNVRTGVSLLKWLDDQFKTEVPDPDERIRFVLAAYNVGLGHVQDAQRLAEKYDRIPIVWTDNVDFFLLNKSSAKYYQDQVVHFGYCRGEETYTFVNRVMNIYQHYCNVIEQ
ncbi:MAG: transporter substrate-binding domain-containing protein [Mangrovibacterium sp.]